MEYVYSALVLHSAGQAVSEDSVNSVLKAAGVKPDASRTKALIAALEGVDIDEALKAAATAPVAVAAAPAAGGGGGDAAAAAAESEDDEDEDDGASEEDAAAGLGALFG